MRNLKSGIQQKIVKSIKISLVSCWGMIYYSRRSIIDTICEEQGGAINQPDNETAKLKRYGENHVCGFIVRTGILGLCFVRWLSNTECSSQARSY